MQSDAVLRQPPTAFTTPATAPRWQRWLWYSPLARIVIFGVLTTLLVLLARLVVDWVGWHGASAPRAARVAGVFASSVLPPLLAYLFLCRVVERRWPAELSWRRVVPDGVAGAIAGIALISTVVGALWLLGGYRVLGTHDVHWSAWLLVAALAAPIAEEIVLRGVLFRITEEGLGTASALAASALVFGIAHLGNPNATAWSAFAIAVEAGLLLGLIYHVWRSLPLCIGVHMGWNAAQGPLYGIPVSGFQAPSWLDSVREGPDWLTGGAFGVEASALAVAISLGCSLTLLALARRRRSLIAPAFARGRHGAVVAAPAAPV